MKFVCFVDFDFPSIEMFIFNFLNESSPKHKQRTVVCLWFCDCLFDNFFLGLNKDVFDNFVRESRFNANINHWTSYVTDEWTSYERSVRRLYSKLRNLLFMLCKCHLDQRLLHHKTMSFTNAVISQHKIFSEKYP